MGGQFWVNSGSIFSKTGTKFSKIALNSVKQVLNSVKYGSNEVNSQSNGRVILNIQYKPARDPKPGCVLTPLGSPTGP